MEETQIPQEKTSPNATLKWVLLIAGCGCALVACAILVVGLALTLLGPAIGNVFSEVNEGLGDTQPVPVTQEADLIPSSQPTEQILTPETIRYPEVSANKMGDPDAPVKIIVYSDFQCIYCMRYWDETELKIIETYVNTGKVYYEYRSFGDFLGPESGMAAEAAYCAGDQGQFWEYHDLLFINLTGEGSGDFSSGRLEQYAKELDLDVQDFSDCLADGTYKPWVERDVTEAQAAGVRATPSFLINSKLVEGALPFRDFQVEIEAALAEN